MGDTDEVVKRGFNFALTPVSGLGSHSLVGSWGPRV